MPRFAATLLALTIAVPAFGDDICDDLWLSRNQLFDRAGYCFSSPLGQAVFDNSDCTGTEVTLDRDSAALLAHIRAMEAEFGCAVNSSRRWLDVDNLGLRLALEVVVARSEFASGCLGWMGAPLALHAGPRAASPLLGRVTRGDDIVWEYETVRWPEGWSFVTTYRDGVQTGLGWVAGDIDQALCSGLAG
jgi:Domain of unknown function (DUF4453)/YARHG domain